MGWERGRYYTRSVKVNGRVEREYVGAGLVAELAARMDERFRRLREAEREAVRAEKASLDPPTALDELNALADVLTRAILLASGCRQHKRGEWRKRRGSRTVSA